MSISERDKTLADELAALHPTHGEWRFEFMYPGLFSYSKGPLTVFFTPDYGEKGTLAIQVDRGDGSTIDLDWPEVRYPEALTSAFLFDEARKVMDHVDAMPGMPSPTSYDRYIACVRALHALLSMGRGESAAADNLRDQMDEPWEDLTEDQRADASKLSARLNAARRGDDEKATAG